MDYDPYYSSMNSFWRSQLFTNREAILCSGGGFAALLIMIFPVASVIDHAWRLPLQLSISVCHVLLVIRATECRARWRIDFSSYMDFLCLVGGFLIAPTYCIWVRSKRK
jgi:hypothetical protein